MPRCLPGIDNPLAKRTNHQHRERPDGEHDGFDNPRGQIGQRDSLAVAFHDREEQNAQAHHCYGVQQHQKDSDGQGGLMCGDRRQKVRAAENGSH